MTEVKELQMMETIINIFGGLGKKGRQKHSGTTLAEKNPDGEISSPF